MKQEKKVDNGQNLSDMISDNDIVIDANYSQDENGRKLFAMCGKYVRRYFKRRVRKMNRLNLKRLTKIQEEL